MVSLVRAVVFGFLGLAVATSVEVGAQESARGGPSDPAELEAFLDGLMAAHLEEFNTAGVTVSVVKDGQLFFAKGYGYADRAERKAVDPGTTLFRIGSVSKLFVWTSVMQLVEEGMLDLDADINGYLANFEIPDTYPEPVTLRHIMSHSAGFEDWIVGLFADDEEKLDPLGDVLSQQIPARVRPPGEVSSYSNHATGMAAYIVEQVSGERWEDFIQDRILEPLGMTYATFDQPLPEALSDHMSNGYSYSGGKFEEEDFELVPLAPVGAAAASAGAMAKFMIAHLQLGRFGEQRILQEETARQMQSELFRMAPGVNPMAYGFMDMSANGERIVGHGGDTFYFHTNLALFPEHDLGIFVSYNSERGGAATGDFVEAFVDRYFPVDMGDVLTAPEDFADRADRFTGHFRANRFSHRSIAKLAAVQAIEITVTEEGALRLLNRDWVEVSPLTFREADGEDTVVFRENEDGKITHFFLAAVPVIAFERVPALESPGLHLVIFILAVASIIGTLISWPGGWVMRRWYKVSSAGLVRIPSGTRMVLWLAAALFAVFALGLAVTIQEPNQLAIAIPTSLRVALALPILAAVLTIAALVDTVQLWRRRQGRTWGRVAHSVVTVLFLLFLWQLHVWNLLGFRF